MTGTLFVVSTPIGNLADLSSRAIEVLATADIIACEDTRHSGRLLAHAGVVSNKLVSLHLHNEASKTPGLIEAMSTGSVVALISDAGTPLVSDPGERLVASAIDAGVPVFAVPGPSAVLAGLTVSGMRSNRWRFEGFLPRKGRERHSRIAEIAVAKHPSICYEAPGRIVATLIDLQAQCGPDRQVAVCRELTKLHEQVWRGPLGDAIAHWTDGESRGEFVLVVAGAEPGDESDEALATRLLFELKRAGLSRKDAVAAIGALKDAGLVDHGKELSRNMVYETSLALFAPA